MSHPVPTYDPREAYPGDGYRPAPRTCAECGRIATSLFCGSCQDRGEDMVDAMMQGDYD